MSTATQTRPAAAAQSDRYKVTFPRLVRSEVIKLTTVRSTIWSLATAFVMIVGISTIMAFASRSASDIFTDGVTVGAFAPILGISLAQLVFVVLGVISIGSEYSTGMIRSTLSASPTRTPSLLAKMLVMFVTSFVVSLVSLFVAHFIVQPILGEERLQASLGDPQVLRMLLGGALFVATLSVFSLAVGAIVRNTAAGISIVVALLLVLGGVLTLIPWKWLSTVADYLPNAGESVMYPASDSAAHTVWGGFGITVVWVVVTSIVAMVLIKRRDA